MKILLRILILFNIVNFALQANTMYTLTTFPKVYLVVENYSSKVNKETEAELMEELKVTTNELNIDISGYSHRSLAILLYETPIEDKVTLNIELAIGELVKRIDDNEESYALTYQQKRQIFYTGKSDEEINDEIIENTMILLNSFAEQYKDDNTKLLNVSNASYKELAKALNYETDYESALKKAKNAKKDIMFIMVANFCPWCIKLEKQILAKNKYNKIIQKQYIPLIINREELKFPKMFDTPIVPTIYFVNYKDESIKKKIVGYKNRFEFIDFIMREYK